jgi:hypothetical protein
MGMPETPHIHLIEYNGSGGWEDNVLLIDTASIQLKLFEVEG